MFRYFLMALPLLITLSAAQANSYWACAKVAKILFKESVTADITSLLFRVVPTDGRLDMFSYWEKSPNERDDNTNYLPYNNDQNYLKLAQEAQDNNQEICIRFGEAGRGFSIREIAPL